MIRRDAKLADGSPGWLLIAQPTHAKFSGELAAEWPAIDDGVLDIGYIASVIARHDDGWATWEQAPTIDLATGAPRSFLEMPSDVASDIWARSIEGVADLGPLAQFMVAEHFCRLRRAGDAEHDEPAREFLATHEGQSRKWLAAWQAEDPQRHTPAVAERAVRWLQFFDRLSLWFCMAERTSPHRFEPASQQPASLEITPKSADQGGEQFAIQPWPMRVSHCEFSFDDLPMIAARRYESDAELHATIAQAPRVTLKWTLDPC